MKKVIIFLLLLIMPVIAISQVKIDRDLNHTTTNYEKLALEQHITNEVVINHLIEWFKNEVRTIRVVTIKKKNSVSVIYYFNYTKRQSSNLEIVFKNNEKIYSTLIFKICVNGRPRTYYNYYAKRMIITLLNKNSEFNYYFIKRKY